MKTGLLPGALLLSALFVTNQAVAQPAPPPPTPPAATIQPDLDAVRAQARANAATRAQIRAIRMALRARLAALHH